MMPCCRYRLRPRPAATPLPSCPRNPNRLSAIGYRLSALADSRLPAADSRSVHLIIGVDDGLALQLFHNALLLAHKYVGAQLVVDLFLHLGVELDWPGVFALDETDDMET